MLLLKKKKYAALSI